jgi:hypothetical protein
MDFQSMREPLKFHALAPAMRRHSSAQRRQASAQRWQCSFLCLAHSAAQSSQMPAQSPQTAFMCEDPRLMKLPAVQQIAAQSMHILAHIGRFSSMHALPQCSHSSAQVVHASMQDWCC